MFTAQEKSLPYAQISLARVAPAHAPVVEFVDKNAAIHHAGLNLLSASAPAGYPATT